MGGIFLSFFLKKSHINNVEFMNIPHLKSEGFLTIFFKEKKFPNLPPKNSYY